MVAVAECKLEKMAACLKEGGSEMVERNTQYAMVSCGEKSVGFMGRRNGATRLCGTRAVGPRPNKSGERIERGFLLRQRMSPFGNRNWVAGIGGYRKRAASAMNGISAVTYCWNGTS